MKKFNNKPFTKKIKFLIIFIIIVLLGQNLYAQITLKGYVTDTKGKALSNINILISIPGKKVLVAFAVSDSKGYFQTKVNYKTDSLDIKLSSIQYHNKCRRISGKSQNLEFNLKYDIKQLDTFTVKASPIKQKHDTISYLVSTFTRKNDRAIEDVLRRMPGIEVEANGKILYQGAPLKKFYVEGLDLMDGSYTVISKNLPNKSVSTVEVLENHQPIKILEDKVESYQAALNLKLKNNITATGSAKLGIGISPFLWDVNITPMIFTKKYQLVASYQSNNTGNDVSQQLNVLTINDLINRIDMPEENSKILNIQSVNPPQINKDRYLDNNIHLFSFNGLQSLNKDIQLRTNIYYINDYQKQSAILKSTYYTPGDTIRFTENFNNRIFDNYLIGKFSLKRNVKKNYFNNILSIKSHWDKQKGAIFNENENIHESLKTPLKSISNNLSSIKTIGKHLVEFKSYISYDNNNHSLEINPGQYQDILNNNQPYDKVLQKIDLNRFYTNNSVNFVFSWKKLNFTPKIGFAFRKQILESNIYIKEEEEEASKDFSNKLNCSFAKAYIQTGIEYRYKKFHLKANLPLSWKYIDLSDKISDDKQSIKKLFLDPSLSINYKINSFCDLRGYWSFSKHLGDIDRVNYGYILKNYRYLNKNAAPISETKRNNFSIYLKYRNPINSLFYSFSYIYAISNKNLMYSNNIQDDGRIIIEAFHKPNKNYINNFNGQISKYFSAAKTTLRFKANFSQQQGKSLINEELFNTKNLFYNFIPGLNVRITNWLNSEYNLNASYIKTFVENNKKSNISLLRHTFKIFAFPTENQLISCTSEFYNHKGKSNIFVDLLYRYSIKKQKIDLEICWKNIFNNETYITYQANSFTIWESSYILRPSQIFLSAKFSF